MTLNGLGLLSVAAYAAWRMWNIKHRAKLSASPSDGIALMLEISYTIVMSFLLTTGNKLFLMVALGSLIVHAIVGGYYELFRPDIVQHADNKIDGGMMGYWSFLITDTAITLLCWVMIGCGGLV